MYGHAIERGFPRSLSSVGLPHSVKSISAALHDPEANKTLFFDGEYYYRYVPQNWPFEFQVRVPF